ncbi:uncharacterized protein N7458_000761 [Penicillium daleae]|uniref:Protein kinase domain-containing protein n=1 Tax=Penicillium daleae TaxID=63821 RepID=A0AAD6CHE6_9EURO|nr:uncharacterized protein N7458_000761 [Penicillium daleae]KAJ5465075.1 hypothetical protein N7458_000761 [Penicillium daleae]
MALRDQSVLGDIAQDEIQTPSPQKHSGNRTIYISRNDCGLDANNIGRLVITDFGLSVDGSKSPYKHTIQPNGFRAPRLFSEQAGIINHLAAMISLIGPPPQDVLKRGNYCSRYFNDEGQFKLHDLITRPGGLENKLNVTEGDEKRMFIGFISKMLRWRPEDRATAEDLFSDPWLQL